MNAGSPPPSAPSPGLLTRFVAVFTNPRGLAAVLREHPHLLGAMLIGAAVSLVFGFVIAGPTVDLMIDAIYESAEADPDAADEIVGAIEDFEPGVEVAIAVSSVFGHLLGLVLWAAILTLIGSAFLGGGVSYRHHLSLVVHANLVNVPGFLLGAVLVGMTGEMSTLSLAQLLGLSVKDPIGLAASWISPFNLWWLWVLGAGMAVYYVTSTARTLVLVVAVSVLLRLINVAMAAAGSMGSAR